MQSIITITLCTFLLILSVQARSIEKVGPSKEDEMSKEPSDRSYSKLLAYLKNQEAKDDSSSSSSEDVKPLPKRGFFLFPNRRSNQRYRPMYSYGRKSHWDTFFG